MPVGAGITLAGRLLERVTPIKSGILLSPKLAGCGRAAVDAVIRGESTS
jgi:hypothetical protein